MIARGGEIKFFVGESEDSEPLSLDFCPGLPVVVLENVRDNAYPPQQKSFMMLAWMWDHFGGQSTWFMRADDDVYVKIDDLLHFLSPINSSEAQFLGQAGRGRGFERLPDFQSRLLDQFPTAELMMSLSPPTETSCLSY